MPSVLADLALNTTASPARRRIDLPRGDAKASFRQQFQEFSTPKPAEPKRQESSAAPDRAASRAASRNDKPAKKPQNTEEVDRDNDDVDETTERRSANGPPGVDSAAPADDDAAFSDDATDAKAKDDSSADSPADEPVIGVVDPSALAATIAVPSAVPATAAATTAADGETGDADTSDVALQPGQFDPSLATEAAAKAEALSTTTDAGDESTALPVVDADTAPHLSAARPTGKPTTGVSSLGGATPPATPDEVTASIDTGEASPGVSAGQNFAEQTHLSMLSDFADAMSPASATVADAPSVDAKPNDAAPTANLAGQSAITGPQVKPTADAQASAAAADAPPVETRFAEANHATIVTGVRGTLLANGGRMELKLDPPELGALQVSLHIKDGVVTASFQTQNPEAARLLSHTLSDLRQSLEAQGVVVDKLHVQQAPKSDNTGSNTQNGDGRPTLSQEQQQENRREQQRKDMVQRLWDQLAGNAPIDVRA